MEIKIDTKKDSSEDIKKTIAFLQTLVGASTSNNASTDFNASGDATSAMVGLFGDTPVMSNEAPKSSAEEDEEEEKEKIELIPY